MLTGKIGEPTHSLVKPDIVAEHSCTYEDDSDHGKDNDYLSRPHRLRKLLATKMSLPILDLLLFPPSQVFELWEISHKP
jgi:hypothetical protein